MSPDRSPSSGSVNVCTALPVLLMLRIPPPTGNVIINGLNLNSVSVTSTVGGPDAVAPDADPLRKPKKASAIAATDTTNAKPTQN